MAKKLVLSGFLSSLLLVSLVAYSLPAFAQGPEDKPGKPDIIAVTGIVPGKDLMVHVIVVVQPGETRNQAAIEALAHQGARPITHEEFSTIALYWDGFENGNPGDFTVVQNYNPKNEEGGAGAGLQALLNTHASWNNVPNSNFEFEYGGETGRCPSLVQECKGRQNFDGNNDVAWMRLNSASTLGVTWSGTSTDEADMALNTSFDWYADGTEFFDIETVFLHENGHVAGLGHSDDITAIMYPSYQALNRVLQPDDIAGISYLYPATENAVPPTLEGCSISPQNGEVNVGSSIEFTLTADYSDGSQVPVTDNVLWNSGDDFIATIDQSTGLAQGIAEGSTTIHATYDVFTCDATITVNPMPETPSFLATVSYDTEGGKNGDKHLIVTVTLDPPVSGTSVTAELLRDGQSIGSATGTTDTNGTAAFSLKNASPGFYTTNVSVNGTPLTDEKTVDPGHLK